MRLSQMIQRKRILLVIKWSLLVVGILLAIIGLLSVQTHRDWAFICEHTGSHKGYRRWFFGMDTRVWYKESKLEAFLRGRLGREPDRKWTSYAGTGRNIIGTVLLRGHGTPGWILYIRLEQLDAYVAHLDDDQKMALYETFRSGDKERIKEKVKDIQDFTLMQFKKNG
jgi:hypothetical protein